MLPRTIILFYLLLISAQLCLSRCAPGKIVGGEEVDILDYHHQVFLKIGQNVCGGTIISKDFILTAAHCVFLNRYTPEEIHIWVNISTIGNFESPHYRVDNVIIHPDFDYDTMIFDAAILDVKNSIIMGPGVMPALLPMPNSENLPNGAKVTLAGWGVTRVGEAYPFLILRAVDLEILEWNLCAEIYSQTDFLAEDMLCARGSNGNNFGACMGDSGSGLVASGILYGIMSWTWGFCADHGFPSVFVDVIQIRQFITNATNL